MRRPTKGGSKTPVFLAGATALGKSAVAIALAERVGGEIISVDSMQVYRGLDIGTAKPSPAERQRAPHHLIDVVGLAESFAAARFVGLARQAVSQIQARGRVPIFCGGTGLYFQAYLAGLGETPPAAPALRAELEATPLAELLRELAACDPVTYARIDQRNPRRVVRALEVIRLTGQPFSTQRAPWPAPPSTLNPQPSTLFCLSRAPTDLRTRIDARVDAMFAHGLVAETQRLLAAGLAQNRTALQALGYRQVVEHLCGQRSLADTIALVKQRTRQFARRQLTWFRHHGQWNWVELQPHTTPEEAAERLIEQWSRAAE